MIKRRKKVNKRKKNLIFDLICTKSYRPMRTKDIAILLSVPKEKRLELRRILDDLVEEGKIILNQEGRYEKANGSKDADQEEKVTRKKKSSGPILTGRFISHPNGFGFVELEEEEEDIFIPKDYVADAMHHDTVEIQILNSQRGRRKEGEVIGVIERGMSEIIGTFEESKSFGFVVPDNARFSKDIFISKEKTLGAHSGDKVIVTIKHFGSPKKKPEGVVKEVLGNIKDKGVDVLSIAKGYELPMEFPIKVLTQADRLSDQLIEGDFEGRKDIRDWVVVTIDGEDAKDLDDGISLTKEGNLYHLGVHIADVTNYVQYKSALDKEAFKRGTSVYLVDRVIPMLPKRLSNGICSLNAGEDRLCLSCFMDIDEKGRVVAHEIAETVINVDRRMSYTNVRKILQKEDDAVMEEYKDLVPMFHLMEELSSLLRKNRDQRGSINFDFPESKIILDEEGKPVEIYPYEQNVATKIIEDFMLMANETVAKEYCKAEIPFVYRTHETPDMEKMESVLTFARNQGFKVVKRGEEITPKEVQEILSQVEGTIQEPLISRLFLRSMKQARYTTTNSAHFGLAADYYCHFTSPIRRYPDLQIHRIIKDTLRGRMDQNKKEDYGQFLEEVAKRSSEMERRAEEVERETDKLKKAEYMTYHIGEIFDGIISGVTGWGLYVELPNTVEGLVHINNMRDDFYTYNDSAHQLIGESFKKVYGLGQSVRVRVHDADIATKTVDFVLEE